MRLIDTKELLNERPENLNPNMNDEIKSSYNKGWNACNSEWIKLIDEHPTAYDIDAVVEQLEKIEVRREEYSETMNCNIEPCTYTSCYDCIRDKAIEIVKGGAE